MFDKNYYCLVAGLKEYTLDADTKGFDPQAILAEIVEALSKRDARCVRLLYGYYDCENLIACRAGRPVHNPLGNLSREEIEQELKSPSLLPAPIAEVVRAYGVAADEEEPESDAEPLDERLFAVRIYEAYYALCARSKSRFLRAWSEFDRTLRNLSAVVTARTAGRAADEVVVGADELTQQIRRSSASDFGLKSELLWLEAALAAIGDEANLVEKERKMDQIRWAQAEELAAFDYFNINMLLSYLVKVNIVARWSRLDERKGREMLRRLIADLDGKELINK